MFTLETDKLSWICYLSLRWGILEDFFCLDDALHEYCKPTIIDNIKSYVLNVLDG